MTIGIYKIQNTASGLCYIGQSIDIELRLQQHLNNLRKGNHINKKLQEDFNESHFSNFIFTPLEELQDSFDLFTRERFYIEKHNSIENGYNIAMPKLSEKQGGSNITNLNIKIEGDLLKEFDKAIKEVNNNVHNPKINKSMIIREAVVNFIKKS